MNREGNTGLKLAEMSFYTHYVRHYNKYLKYLFPPRLSSPAYHHWETIIFFQIVFTNCAKFPEMHDKQKMKVSKPHSNTHEKRDI